MSTDNPDSKTPRRQSSTDWLQSGVVVKWLRKTTDLSATELAWERVRRAGRVNARHTRWYSPRFSHFIGSPSRRRQAT